MCLPTPPSWFSICIILLANVTPVYSIKKRKEKIKFISSVHRQSQVLTSHIWLVEIILKSTFLKFLFTLYDKIIFGIFR